MNNIKTDIEIDPMAFANMAARYERAASLLYAGITGDGKNVELADPIYFLYFHAVELSLKGFLRSRGRTTSELRKQLGHQLMNMYDDAAQLGLRIAGIDKISVRNVVSLLDGANYYQGLRYFTMRSRTLPNLDWTSRIVHTFVEQIRGRLVAADPDGGKPGPAVKLDMIISEPQPRK